MKKFLTVAFFISIGFVASRCNQEQTDNSIVPDQSVQTLQPSPANAGFESKEAWGKHIVTIGGCNHCHTPRKMGPAGPEPDMELELSGRPEKMPAINIDHKDIESKGLAVTNMTEWVGPWGISYASNISSDPTSGIGNWTEYQFILCLRTGKFGGAPAGRELLPPMPWQDLGNLTDDELKAVFAYLKSTKPIHNIVPQPQPPSMAMKK